MALAAELDGLAAPLNLPARTAADGLLRPASTAPARGGRRLRRPRGHRLRRPDDPCHPAVVARRAGRANGSRAGGETLLRSTGITVRFGGVTANDAVSLAVPSGMRHRPHRAERRREDDAVQRRVRRGRPSPRARSPATARTSPAPRPGAEPGTGSSAPSRTSSWSTPSTVLDNVLLGTTRTCAGASPRDGAAAGCADRRRAAAARSPCRHRTCRARAVRCKRARRQPALRTAPPRRARPGPGRRPPPAPARRTVRRHGRGRDRRTRPADRADGGPARHHRPAGRARHGRSSAPSPITSTSCTRAGCCVPGARRRAGGPGGPARSTSERSTPMSDAPMLELTAVEAGYGSVRALAGCRPAVRPGETVALLGRNGAARPPRCGWPAMIAPGRGRVALRRPPLKRSTTEDLVGRGLAHVPEGRACSRI